MGILDIFKKKEIISNESKSTSNVVENIIVDLFNGNNNPTSESCEFVYYTHQRFEHGVPRPEQLNINRTIRIEKNISGNIGYSISIRDGETDRVTLAPKPMKIIEHTSDKVVLKGYGYDAFAVAMGAPMEIASFECYAISLLLKDNVVYKCISHWLDRDINIEYYDKNLNESRNILSEDVLRSIKSENVDINRDRQSETQPPVNSKIAKRMEAVRYDASMCSVMKLIDLAILYEERGDISNLQNILFQVANNMFGMGSGIRTINFPNHIKLCRFYAYLLKYDWQQDSDLREVCVENGFYCYARYMMSEIERVEEAEEAYFVLFLLLTHGKDSFETCISDILAKSQMMGRSEFSDSDYKKGASFVIEQFIDFAYLEMSPYTKKNKTLFQKYMQSDNKFLHSIKSRMLSIKKYKISREEIQSKMSFIAMNIDYTLRNS